MREVVIVPAREGSKGIYLKNMRFLNKDETLLSEAFKNALKITDEANIYLSTESNLLKAYGEAIGYKNLSRPKNISDDQATLDDVIKYHTKHSDLEIYDTMWVLQATCPFLESSTVKEMKRLINMDTINTVFTAKEIKGFMWKREKIGDFEELYLKLYNMRVNRQVKKEQNYLVETGLLTCSKIEFLKLFNGERYAGNNGIVPVICSGDEALDIDTYTDLEIAMNIYHKRNNKVLIVCHASKNEGTGHLYRALSLMDMSFPTNCKLAVIGDNYTFSLLEKMEREIIKLKNKGHIIAEIDKDSYDMIILDMLNVDKLLLDNIKSKNIKCVVFENTQDHVMENADLVINALYETSIERKNVRHGYQYEIIRPDIQAFNTIKRALREDSVKKPINIMTCFGGTDANNFNQKMNTVYSILEERLGEIPQTKLAIIEFLNLRGDNQSNYQPRSSRLSVKTYEHSNLVGREIAKCDIMICGNGRMVYEGASLQKKIIAIPQNSRESTHNFVKLLPGSHMMDIWNEISLEYLAETLIECLDELKNESVKSKIMKETISKDIADGAARVWTEIRDLLG